MATKNDYTKHVMYPDGIELDTFMQIIMDGASTVFGKQIFQ